MYSTVAQLLSKYRLGRLRINRSVLSTDPYLQDISSFYNYIVQIFSSWLPLLLQIQLKFDLNQVWYVFMEHYSCYRIITIPKLPWEFSIQRAHGNLVLYRFTHEGGILHILHSVRITLNHAQMENHLHTLQIQSTPNEFFDNPRLRKKFICYRRWYLLMVVL